MEGLLFETVFKLISFSKKTISLTENKHKFSNKKLCMLHSGLHAF